MDKPRSQLALLTLAVVAVSTAAPAIRLGSGPALTVAFWRVTLATLGIGMICLARRHRLGRWRQGLTPLAGLLLGLHFWVWIASLEFVSVARSVLLVSTQPVWAALLARLFLGEHVGRRAWFGILIALAGTAVAAGGLTLPGRGDLLAVAGAVLAAGYMVVGRRERPRLDILPFLLQVYGWASVTLLAALLVTHSSFWPAGPSDWGLYLFLAAVPTGIGHSLYNYSLRHLPAHAVATAITLEPVGASLLAFLLFRESPEATTWLAAPVIVWGLWLVLPRGDAAGR